MVRVRRTEQGRATIEDLTPGQFATLVDALDELNRPDNPVRPFSHEFQSVVDALTLQLSKGLALFSIDERSTSAVPARFRLRVVRPDDSGSL